MLAPFRQQRNGVPPRFPDYRVLQTLARSRFSREASSWMPLAYRGRATLTIDTSTTLELTAVVSSGQTVVFSSIDGDEA